MKKAIVFFSKLLSVLTLCFFQTIAWAQDKQVDVNINTDKGGGQWYTNPWVWVIGGAVFILLLVAILRSNSKD